MPFRTGNVSFKFGIQQNKIKPRNLSHWGPYYVTLATTYNHPKINFFTPLIIAAQTIKGCGKLIIGEQ